MPQNEVKNNLSDPGNFIDQVRSSNNLKMSEDEQPYKTSFRFPSGAIEEEQETSFRIPNNSSKFKVQKTNVSVN